jgi:hypothetical protein
MPGMHQSRAQPRVAVPLTGNVARGAAATDSVGPNCVRPRRERHSDLRRDVRARRGLPPQPGRSPARRRSLRNVQIHEARAKRSRDGGQDARDPSGVGAGLVPAHAGPIRRPNPWAPTRGAPTKIIQQESAPLGKFVILPLASCSQRAAYLLEYCRVGEITHRHQLCGTGCCKRSAG